MKVDFMIVGAQKSGTTSLADQLAAHPEICFCNEKEPDFFSKEHNWKEKLEKYHQLYFPKPGNRIFGEASTTYAMLPEHPETVYRLYEYNPDLKIIYIMRDPVERIISHYAHRFVRKRIHRTLENELENNRGYIDRSRYYYQIKPYLERFEKDNIFLIVFDNFIKNPKLYLEKLSHFLEVDAHFFAKQKAFNISNPSANRKILADHGLKIFNPIKKIGKKMPVGMQNLALWLMGNTIKNKPEFSTSLKRKLYYELLPDIKQIENLLGEKIDVWKEY